MKTAKTVVLIDDDPDDRELLQEALRAIDKGHLIMEARDGVEGLQNLDVLKQKGELPCLIVLDLNMPRLDGKSTFTAIRADQTLSKIPLVVFSTSNSKLDKMFFEHYNTAYFVKPVKLQELSTTAAHMIQLCQHNSEEEKDGD